MIVNSMHHSELSMMVGSFSFVNADKTIIIEYGCDLQCHTIHADETNNGISSKEAPHYVLIGRMKCEPQQVAPFLLTI